MLSVEAWAEIRRTIRTARALISGSLPGHRSSFLTARDGREPGMLQLRPRLWAWRTTAGYMWWAACLPEDDAVIVVLTDHEVDDGHLAFSRGWPVPWSTPVGRAERERRRTAVEPATQPATVMHRGRR